MKNLVYLLHPRTSKLRPYLALLALKNFHLLKEGHLVGNNPSIRWYYQHLRRLGITENYQGVRKQLYLMVEQGLFIVKRIPRACMTRYLGHRRITKIAYTEFYLREERVEELTRVLSRLFPQVPEKKIYEPPVCV